MKSIPQKGWEEHLREVWVRVCHQAFKASTSLTQIRSFCYPVP